ncbi:hypothetical protein OF83DRAFT_407401 [Amylostereum chailletii]|nr:hypothetical protein OF83DRAFT_407401 [Amylostereum chailletii]
MRATSFRRRVSLTAVVLAHQLVPREDLGRGARKIQIITRITPRIRRQPKTNVYVPNLRVMRMQVLVAEKNASMLHLRPKRKSVNAKLALQRLEVAFATPSPRTYGFLDASILRNQPESATTFQGNARDHLSLAIDLYSFRRPAGRRSPGPSACSPARDGRKRQDWMGGHGRYSCGGRPPRGLLTYIFFRPRW